MRKNFVIVLSLLLFIMGLTACGSSNTPELIQELDTGDEFPDSGIDLIEEYAYAIIINGRGFSFEAGGAEDVYTLAGEAYPTHVTMGIIWTLGIDAISAGIQTSLQHNGPIGVELRIVNYLTFGADRVDVGINDTFMADDGYFTTYLPLSLIRHLGFEVDFKEGRVYIDGEFNLTTTSHPLAIALKTFMDQAIGETQAHTPTVDGYLGVLAIEFIDTFFTEATLFVDTGEEVLSKKIGNIDGFPFSVGFTTDGRGSLVKLSGDGGNRSYGIFEVVMNPTTLRNEIAVAFTIYAEREDLPNFEHRFNYYRYEGSWLAGVEGGRYPITEDEFNWIREGMGMGEGIFSWHDVGWDSTADILSWVEPSW